MKYFNLKVSIMLFVTSLFSLTCSIIAADRHISLLPHRIEVASSSYNGLMSETVTIIPRDTIFSTGLVVFPAVLFVAALFFFCRFLMTRIKQTDNSLLV